MTSGGTDPAHGTLTNPFFPHIQTDLLARAVSRLEKLAYFSDEDYYGLHKDIVHNAAEHALLWGVGEGRKLFRKDRIARALVSTTPTDRAYPPLLADDELNRLSARGITIYASSLGNVFMTEIASDLAMNISELGIPTRILDETSDPEDTDAIAIYVAPHEFFSMGQGRAWLRDRTVRNGFMYNTEQIPSPWFTSALPMLMLARGIFDIAYQPACLFAQAGIPAMHWEPGLDGQPPAPDEFDRMHPLFRTLPPGARDGRDHARWQERPIDLCFFGTNSPRRDDILAYLAAPLSSYQTCIHYRRQALGPVGTRFEERSLTRLSRYITQQAKISLNIHRDEFCYFEWHRMVCQGMAMGAVVVTDPCLPHPRFQPGVHYFQDDARHIPNLVDWLLRDPEGRRQAAQVARNGRDAACSPAPRRAAAGRAVNFMLSHLHEEG
ncbi:CgeB family protein [Gluconacetobacter tumulisoli]|uniref:Glycosyltransferase family 1 protein n=1 Tax=Gluconacetobacter tumulisoli TaxID=1286189 RepID=A0A7W4PMN9_9PROT|nr:glycosyltransferase [Gluconacetobacter tumulisoli]MBB2203213.1 glycosyltransferase family 1 protein [Gluconacetobacter tumulisoli]